MVPSRFIHETLDVTVIDRLLKQKAAFIEGLQKKFGPQYKDELYTFVVLDDMVCELSLFFFLLTLRRWIRRLGIMRFVSSLLRSAYLRVRCIQILDHLFMRGRHYQIFILVASQAVKGMAPLFVLARPPVAPLCVLQEHSHAGDVLLLVLPREVAFDLYHDKLRGACVVETLRVFLDVVAYVLWVKDERLRLLLCCVDSLPAGRVSRGDRERLEAVCVISSIVFV